MAQRWPLPQWPMSGLRFRVSRTPLVPDKGSYMSNDADSYEVVIIGKGLIGSAAFKHCCELGAHALLIGPDEPDDPAAHDGVFGAHYDQARLTHLHGKSKVWAELGRRSIESYRDIERASGIDFYQPVGELFVSDAGISSAYCDPVNLERSRVELGALLTELDDEERVAEFPFLAFGPGSSIVWEESPAGHINPRALIEAQVAIGEGVGGDVRSMQVERCDVGVDGVLVTAVGGREFAADRVLVAAGSFSNVPGLLPEPLPLTLKTEFVVFGRVADGEAERLAHMPVIHYDIDDPALADIYMVPPVRYPDGHHYIKMGANTVVDQFLTTVREMCDWYGHGDSDVMLDVLRDAVVRIVPGIEVLDWHTGRCVITRTPNGLPIIKPVVDDRLYVAVGGNGSSAYCSDALGHLAAGLVVHRKWTDSLDQAVFDYETFDTV